MEPLFRLAPTIIATPCWRSCLRGVMRERTRRLGFGLLANELARHESSDPT
jgi:hypothetical protein